MKSSSAFSRIRHEIFRTSWIPRISHSVSAVMYLCSQAPLVRAEVLSLCSSSLNLTRRNRSFGRQLRDVSRDFVRERLRNYPMIGSAPKFIASSQRIPRSPVREIYMSHLLCESLAENMQGKIVLTRARKIMFYYFLLVNKIRGSYARFAYRSRVQILLIFQSREIKYQFYMLLKHLATICLKLVSL